LLSFKKYVEFVKSLYLVPANCRGNQTPQVLPSKPIVTFPCSTITGILREPFEYLSIDSSFLLSDITLTYSKSFPAFRYASRAAVVKGQVSLPKIRIFSAINSSRNIKKQESKITTLSNCRKTSAIQYQLFTHMSIAAHG